MNGKPSRCLCCGRDEARFFFMKEKDGERYPVYRCRFCESAFVWPRPSEEVIAALYREGHGKWRSREEGLEVVRHYHPTALHDADRILRRFSALSHDRRLLDVGAGPGHFSHAAIQKGFSVAALEPNAASRMAFKRLNGFEPDAGMFDEAYADRGTGAFDGVVASHVLEHILDPEAFVRHIRQVLKTGGIAMIAVPHFGSALSRLQGKGDMFISPPEHLNFFSRAGLERLFGRNGLELAFMETPSKVPRRRIEEIVKAPVLSTLAWVWLYQSLAFFDRFRMGMVINACFRKT